MGVTEFQRKLKHEIENLTLNNNNFLPKPMATSNTQMHILLKTPINGNYTPPKEMPSVSISYANVPEKDTAPPAILKQYAPAITMNIL